MQRAASSGPGVVRSAEGLTAAAEPAMAEWETTNLHQVATALTHVATLRTETRGGHLRLDHPAADDGRWLVRRVVALDREARLAVRELPVR